MRPFIKLCVLSALTLISGTVAAPVKRQEPTVVTPGGPEDIIISEFNTLNGTAPTGPHPGPNPSIQAQPGLRVDLVNNFGSNPVNIYVTALDTSGQVVMLTPGGTWYYPTSSSSTVPQSINQNVAIPLGSPGSTTSITLPGYFTSGRVYFVAGEVKFYTLKSASGGTTLVSPDPLNPSDPSAGVLWGFAELSYTQAGGIYANLSFVDFVGMPVGMQLTVNNGATQKVLGTNKNAVSNMCSAMQARTAADGAPWADLCQRTQSGTLVRVNSPGKWAAVHGDAFSSYYSAYVDQVWNRFSSQPLIIHPQNGMADISCSTSSGTMVCNGASRTYPKPSALEIFGCQGVYGRQANDNAVDLAIVPRVCAAFHRTTLLLAGGEQQPSLPASSYYTTSPSDYYAQALHQNELDGRGYAFAFDDVNPDGAPDASGAVVSSDPQVWTLFVGGS